jgi:hypothetical protein
MDERVCTLHVRAPRTGDREVPVRRGTDWRWMRFAIRPLDLAPPR